MNHPLSRTTHIARALALALAAALLAPVASGAASDEAAPSVRAQLDAEVGADPGVAEAVRREVALPADAPQVSAPADEKAAAEKPPAEAAPGKALEGGRREMTLDEIRELPLLKRYNLSWEEGEAMLGDVKDRTFDYDESAFWWLVDKVARMPAEAFRAGGLTTGYSQLLAMPSAYRGQPVTLTGAYLKVTPFTTPILAIRKDVPTLYEVNIRELPMDQELPVATVIVTEDPMTYLTVFDTVRVTGYFYKIRSYQGSKGPGESPMLVAQRLEPLDESSAAAADSGRGSWDFGTWAPVYIMGFALLVLGGFFFWTRQRMKGKPHAGSARPVHRFRLRRPDWPEPGPDAGPPGGGDQPQQEDGPDHGR
jgi:hypothetical protein